MSKEHSINPWCECYGSAVFMDFRPQSKCALAVSGFCRAGLPVTDVVDLCQQYCNVKCARCRTYFPLRFYFTGGSCVYCRIELASCAAEARRLVIPEREIQKLLGYAFIYWTIRPHTTAMSSPTHVWHYLTKLAHCAYALRMPEDIIDYGGLAEYARYERWEQHPRFVPPQMFRHKHPRTVFHKAFVNYFRDIMNQELLDVFAYLRYKMQLMDFIDVASPYDKARVTMWWNGSLGLRPRYGRTLKLIYRFVWDFIAREELPPYVAKWIDFQNLIRGS